MVQGPYKYIPLHPKLATTELPAPPIWRNSPDQFDPYSRLRTPYNVNSNFRTSVNTNEKSYLNEESQIDSRVKEN
jgi:hypothetical protein